MQEGFSEDRWDKKKTHKYYTDLFFYIFYSSVFHRYKKLPNYVCPFKCIFLVDKAYVYSNIFRYSTNDL